MGRETPSLEEDLSQRSTSRSIVVEDAVLLQETILTPHESTDTYATGQFCTSPQMISYPNLLDANYSADEYCGNGISSQGISEFEDPNKDENNVFDDTYQQSHGSGYLPMAYRFLGSEKAVNECLTNNANINTFKAREQALDDPASVSTWSSKNAQAHTDWHSSTKGYADNSYFSLRSKPRRSLTTESSFQGQGDSRFSANVDQGKSVNTVSMNYRAMPMNPTVPNIRPGQVPVRPAPEASRSSGNISAFSDLSNSGSTHFGPGLRAKLNTVLPLLLKTVPVGPSRTVMIAEYGCMNSRAIHLLRMVLEQLTSIAFAMKSDSVTISESQNSISPPSHRATMTGLVKETADTINFVVLHEDMAQSDFRWFQQVLDTHPESYLDPLWQSSQTPSLQSAIYNAFVARPFGSRIVPPDSLNVGFSLMDLHWIHSPATDISLPTVAHAELTMSLNARAREFRRGGIFVLAFIARTEDANSDSVLERQYSRMNCFQDDTDLMNSSRPKLFPAAVSEQDVPIEPSHTSPLSEKPQRDIWTAMSDMIVPCLQRLVSCGMMKIDVARSMLTLPMYPRTASQTLRVLEKFSDIWTVEWSCGLGRSDTREIVSDLGETVSLQSEPDTLRLPQPAWMALKSGKILPSAYNEHVINMFKNLYETHFRLVLRERGKLNKGAVEFILDSLWDVLRSRMGDPQTCPLADGELEVQLIALRRL